MRTVMPLTAAQWALGGFYLSLGPSLAKAITGSSAPMVGGALIGTLLVSAAASIFVVGRHSARTALVLGATALGLGVLMTLVGMRVHSTVAFFAGTLIAGTGFGASFNGAIRSIAPLPAPHERAGLMSSFFVLSYLAFSVPSILAGLAAGVFGLYATALGYAGTLSAVLVGALVRIRGDSFQSSTPRAADERSFRNDGTQATDRGKLIAL
jgi:MFS family permease